MTTKFTQSEMVGIITREIASISGTDPKLLISTDSLGQLGLSSLHIIQVIKSLEATLGKPLSPTLFFDSPSLENLAARLIGEQLSETAYMPHPNQPSKDSSSTHSSAIAIIGIGCAFPGASSPEEFWQVLQSGQSMVHPLSDQDPRFAAFSSAEIAIPNAAFLNHIASFDHELFGISALEAEKMDPAQRLLLQTAWHTLENAGFRPSSLANSATGVFVGMSSNDYHRTYHDPHSTTDIYDVLGNALSIAANRLSYVFDFVGPSMTIDTACSASLVAIHQACRSLRDKECKQALAGGVNLILAPDTAQSLKSAGMLAANGHCKTFSADADGYGRGEGAGLILLKRLEDAQAEGDSIVAIIPGSAINQDGRSNGMTAPNLRAQEAVIRAALAAAQIDPQEIDFIECHGTGTPLGDPIEFEALNRVFSPTENSHVLPIGSVKTVVGHLEAAAGICGLIKAVLAIHHRRLPASLHFSRLNPNIQANTTRLTIADQAIDLNEKFDSKHELAAGVSSFGFGGANAHIILKSYQKPNAVPIPPDLSPIESTLSERSKIAFLALSATSESSLRETCSRYLCLLSNPNQFDLQSACHQAALGRDHQRERLTVSGTPNQVTEGLAAFLKTNDASPSDSIASQHFHRGSVRKIQRKVAFIFTGQGSQFPGMAQDLYHNFKTFRQAVDRCCELFNAYLPISLKKVMFSSVEDPELQSALNHTEFTQAAIFCFEWACFQLIVQSGVKPDILVGHSVGEIAAAVCAEGLSLEDGVRLVAARGKLMAHSNPEGSMLVCFNPLDQVEKDFQSNDFNLEIAAVNGARQIVVTGLSTEINRYSAYLKQNSIPHKTLRTNRAFHSKLLDPVLDDFQQIASSITYQPMKIGLLSTYSTETLHNLSGKYWRDQARHATLFLPALQELQRLDINTIVELGPHAALMPVISEVFNRSQTDLIALGSAKHSLPTFIEGLSQLYFCFNKFDFSGLFPTKLKRPLSIPLTVFQRKYFWLTKLAATFQPQNPPPLLQPTQSPVIQNNRPLTANEIAAGICQIVQDVLSIPEADLNLTAPIEDFGADSLMLLKALVQIKDRFGVDIPVYSIFQELGSIGAIIDHVTLHLQELPQVAAQSIQSVSSKPTVTAQSGTSNTPGSGKGVLGNFSSHFSMIDSIEKANDPFIEQFAAQTAKSKALTQQHRMALADNRTSAGFRPQTKEITYPIICHKAQGSRFHDVDGNQYIDLTMGFGVNLFGHSPQFIMSAIEQQLSRGLCIGPQSHLAGEVAELICQITGHKRVAFCNSGTEAIMTAIRLARAGTKRSKVVIFEGSYHGHADVVLGRRSADGSTAPVAPGVPTSLVQDLVVLEYGSEASLDFIKEHAEQLAAVVVEPVQSRFPEYQPIEFLKKIRTITSAKKCAFIFDEVITGFRAAPGGVSSLYNIKPDISCYGKILGGGFPIGAVAGDQIYLDAIDGGYWQFGDTSYPTEEMTFFAGTFSKHPLAMAAALVVLKELHKNGQKICNTLNQKTANLAQRLNTFFEQNGFDIEVVYFASLFRLKSKSNLDALFQNLNYQGIYIWEGRNMFLSTAHTDEDIETCILKIQKISLKLQASGVLKRSLKSTILGTVAPSPAQQRFINFHKKSPLAQQAAHIYFGLDWQGPLDRKILKESFEILSQTHDVFRLVFNTGEFPQLTMIPEMNPITITFHSVTEGSLQDLDKLLENLSNQIISIDHEPCLKVHLIEQHQDRYLIIFIGHHALLDGWSIALILDQVVTLYQAIIANQDLPKFQSMSYLNDTLKRVDNASINPKVAQFWQGYLNSSSPISFPIIDGQAKPYAGKRITRIVSGSEWQQFKEVQRQIGVNQLSLLLSCYSQVLHRTFNTNDFIIGVPAACRLTESEMTMIGNCVNILPVRIQSQSFDIISLAQDLYGQWHQLFRHQSMPYRDIEGTVDRPLISTCFNREPYGNPKLPDDVKWQVKALAVNATEWPLSVNVTDFGSHLHIECDYQLAYFNCQSITRLLDDFCLSLNSIGPLNRGN